MAELSIFYCEEAIGFLKACGLEDEGYFLALIRMYNKATGIVLQLSPADRAPYVERLNKLRSRASHVGWGVENQLNDIWFDADLDENPEQ